MRPVIPLRAWRAEFLLSRGHAAATGKPLYSYQVKAGELAELSNLLRADRKFVAHPLYGESWAAGFCMFVAESYRREYDGGDEGWAWTRFEKQLDCSFTQQRRTDLVEAGLRFWKRPVRQRDGRRDLLGSLCLEGGLPWPLVQSGTHAFGKAVRRGLKYFYRTEGGTRTTAELIADSERDLPLLFRNLDTRHLLAGIVEQLMQLVRSHELSTQADPAGYLDRRTPTWREDFPIPLDEENARTLVSDWLLDAGRRTREHREALEREQTFACAHKFMGSFQDWRIQTDLTVPPESTFAVDARLLAGTRLELAFYEGERLVARGGPVYGRLGDGSLAVRFSRTQFSIDRRHLNEPVTLRLLQSGRTVHVVAFDNSDIDINDLPLVFALRDEQKWLVATSSCSLTGELAWVRLPPHAAEVSGAFDLLESQENGARWIRIHGAVAFQIGEDRYQVDLGSSTDSRAGALSLRGHQCLLESLPATVFVGWPSLAIAEGADWKSTDLEILRNGHRLGTEENGRLAGVFRYTVRDQNRATVLRRVFGVLTEGFGVQLLPAVGERSARIVLRNSQGLSVTIKAANVSVRREDTEDGIVIHLRPGDLGLPHQVEIELSSPGVQQPVTLRLPYPHIGARLIDRDGHPSQARELILEELLGTQLLLSSSNGAGQDFFLQFELFDRENLRLKRHYRVSVLDVPVFVSLFGYMNDLLHMFGAVGNQDAYVRLVVETDHELMRLNIRRYNGYLRRETALQCSVHRMGMGTVCSGAVIEAMMLGDPRKAPIPLLERESQGVGTGIFSTAPAMEHHGPWLIYPSKNSAIKFRPELYGQHEFEDTTPPEPESLHAAARIFHPEKYSDVIDRQIEAMAVSFDHGGWQYLDDLRRNFGHLPLSTFESWLSLAGSNDTLAASLFRLEVDEDFCARLRDELAVTWECISIETWVRTFERFHLWLTSRGVPEALVGSLLENRKKILKTVVPAFEHLGEYLATGDSASLQRVPIAPILLHHYRELRRNHAMDTLWPTDLNMQLTVWANRQPLPAEIKQLSNVEDSHSVTYLPIFMAHVTVGRSKLSELGGHPSYLKFVIRKIADFDRQGWYVYAYAVTVAYLLSSEKGLRTKNG